MNILLVYPKYPDTFWSFKKSLRFVSKTASSPPLGLLTVAALLPKAWNKKLIDENIEDLTNTDLIWADWVMVGGMVIQKQQAQAIILRAKAFNKIVIAGGSLFTVYYEQFTGVDYFVLNEAEVTLPLFLEDWEKGCPKKIYTSQIKAQLKDSPTPLWSLIKKPRKYVSTSVQYSRGCPEDCDFCDITLLFGRVPRVKYPGQFIAELKALYERGWRGSVFIADDNIYANKLHVKEMLGELAKFQKQHNFPFIFTVQVTVNVVDDKEMMQLMHQSKITKVFIGIETPSDSSLRGCNKLPNINRNLDEDVLIFLKYGMEVMAGFIIGFDHDPKDIVDQQIRFINDSSIVVSMFGKLTVTPGTRLWNQYQQEKRLLGYPTGDNMDASINYLPKIGLKNLLMNYKQVLEVIYHPRNYYRRIHNMVANLGTTVKGGSNRINWSNVKALFKSLWFIGVVSKERWLYWQLVIKTIFKQARLLPLVIEYSITGVHMINKAREICQDIASRLNKGELRYQ